MIEDNDGMVRKTRSTIDERLAAVRLEEAKLHAAKRAKRTHGLIKIGGAIVADAGTSVGIQDWLHRLWLKTELRDREAIEIASFPLDLTKPHERLAPTQQVETSEPKTSHNDMEATSKTPATQVTATLASHGASSTAPSHQGFQPHQNVRPSPASITTSNEKLPDPAAQVASRTVLPATRPHLQSQHSVSPTKTELSNTAEVERAPNIPPAGGTSITKTTSPSVTGTES